VLRWLVLGLVLLAAAGCMEGQKPTNLRQTAPAAPTAAKPD
jgi:hypothetical protein